MRRAFEKMKNFTSRAKGDGDCVVCLDKPKDSCDPTACIFASADCADCSEPTCVESVAILNFTRCWICSFLLFLIVFPWACCGMNNFLNG